MTSLGSPVTLTGTPVIRVGVSRHQHVCKEDGEGTGRERGPRSHSLLGTDPARSRASSQLLPSGLSYSSQQVLFTQ